VPTLLLFDIDGTLLIKAADDHRDAIHAAIRRVYHVREPERARVEAAGRTDPQIARAIVLQLGLSAERFEDGMTDFKRVAAEEYAHRCRDDLSPHLAPGAVEVLEGLAARDDVVLSLVTGNLEPIARVKLGRAGLGHHFARRQGGFGSDHEDRTELPAIARARAGHDRTPHPRESTVVIGDTPLDIACARADGVRCIAVTTGPYRADALADADAVVGSLRELPALLAGP
jgi:phosphoglycolate phosphatase-like HAD superfamily hydrolase